MSSNSEVSLGKEAQMSSHKSPVNDLITWLFIKEYERPNILRPALGSGCRGMEEVSDEGIKKVSEGGKGTCKTP